MSGVGRGRGWLNIKREPEAPGGIMNTKTEEDPIQKFLGYIDNITEIPSKYSKAFHDFETISDEKRLKKTLAKYQYDEEDVYRCILLLVQKYLLDWNMSCTVVQNAYALNHKAVLNSVQAIFDNREYLFKRNKPAVVKLMVILARLHSLMAISLTVKAAFQCSQYILDPVQNEYVPIFTKCLHQVFNSEVISPSGKHVLLAISTDKYIKFEEFCLLSKLRQAICATNDATTRYWLYLARDIWDHGRQILPEETLAFYENHLGTQEINYFRKVVDVEQPLYLDTNQSLHSLDQYVSGVSVLKIDDSPPNQDRQTQNDINHGAIVNVPNSDRNLGTSSQHRANNSNPPLHVEVPPVTPIQYVPEIYQQPPPPILQSAGGGRAILGAGARNHRSSNNNKHNSPRYEQASEAMNGWRDKQPAQHHAGAQYSGGGGSRGPPPDLPRNHSAWNHDDRC